MRGYPGSSAKIIPNPNGVASPPAAPTRTIQPIQEFLQGSKSKMDLSLIYPVDPKQLPKELAGVEWPPKE